jgi:hypothetical protein
MIKGKNTKIQPTTPENSTGTNPAAVISAAVIKVANTPPAMRASTPATAVLRLSAADTVIFIINLLVWVPHQDTHALP